MPEAMYVSRATVTPAGKLQRHAVLESGAEARFGVHGPIAEFFKLAPPTPLPLPVDYVVAATADNHSRRARRREHHHQRSR